MAEAARAANAPDALPALEPDLDVHDGNPRALLVGHELDEVALDIEGMHAALGRVASP